LILLARSRVRRSSANGAAFHQQLARSLIGNQSRLMILDRGAATRIAIASVGSVRGEREGQTAFFLAAARLPPLYCPEWSAEVLPRHSRKAKSEVTVVAFIK
jgi:hypothetical protein